jgi:hypothetical protein
MMLITALIALPVGYAEQRRAAQIGIVHGLFTGSPEWTPH